MKLDAICGRNRRHNRFVASSHQFDITVAVATNDTNETTIENKAVRELLNLQLDIGTDISKYMSIDEIALMNCIVRFGIQDSGYRPTAAVESFARYLQARCELSRALA